MLRVSGQPLCSQTLTRDKREGKPCCIHRVSTCLGAPGLEKEKVPARRHVPRQAVATTPEERSHLQCSFLPTGGRGIGLLAQFPTRPHSSPLSQYKLIRYRNQRSINPPPCSAPLPFISFIEPCLSIRATRQYLALRSVASQVPTYLTLPYLLTYPPFYIPC